MSGEATEGGTGPSAPSSGAGGAFGPTPSQTAGPYLAIGLAPLAAHELVEPGSPGAVTISGRLLDGEGRGVPDGAIEIWQADPDGRFPPESAPGWTGLGRCLTDEDGGYRFLTLKPGRLTGPGGEAQAPHLEVLVLARGLLRQVRTRMYFPDEAEANGRDPLLSAIPDPGRRATLVAAGEGGELHFDIRLQGPEETVFFAP